ncbi:DUF5958 family protein [Spirillospora sp. NPDC052242]
MDEQAEFLTMLALGEKSMLDGREWFNGHTVEERRDIVRQLAYYAAQAGARADDVEPSAREAGLKMTFTPVVMASKAPSAGHLTLLANLPEHELEKAFRLLVALFSMADARRYATYCADGCTHEWHRRRREHG